MFTVTDEAATELKSMLDDADDRPEGHTFRIGFDEKDRPGLFWDEPATEDYHIQVNDETVLLIDEDALDILDDVIMDVVEADGGSRLKLSRQTS